MNGDSWLAVALLVGALVMLTIATAAEAGVAFISRLRVRAFATRGLPRAASLDTYMQERHAVLGTLSVARQVAVVLGIAVGTFLVLRETGHTWIGLTLTMVGAIAALALLEASSRLIVANSPERWSLRLVPAISVFRFVFGIPARALDFAAHAALRRSGRSEVALDAEDDDEELLRLVEMHEGNGHAQDGGELEMIRRIANMVDRAVREIMVPRIDMVTAETTDSLDDVLKLITERGYSRIPIYEETIDNVVGVVYAKDILRFLADGRRPASLREISRPPYFVPEGKRIDELLTELREHKVHMALVVDEYGGTAGLVTIEDVLEEIVGEIQDEYDREEATVQRVTEDEAIVDARTSLDDLNELLEVEMESEDVDTVGGFVYHQLGRMPVPGDEVQQNGLTMRVLSVAGRRIGKVRVTRSAGDHEDEAEPD